MVCPHRKGGRDVLGGVDERIEQAIALPYRNDRIGPKRNIEEARGLQTVNGNGDSHWGCAKTVPDHKARHAVDPDSTIERLKAKRWIDNHIPLKIVDRRRDR